MSGCLNAQLKTFLYRPTIIKTVLIEPREGEDKKRVLDKKSCGDKNATAVVIIICSLHIFTAIDPYSLLGGVVLWTNGGL